VDDAIVIDWICTSLSDNLNRSNTWEQQEKQTTSHKDDEQTNVARRRRNHKIKNEIDVKITYFNKMEREKWVRGVILGQKLILNHPSLVDEGKETSVLAMADKREREKRVIRRNTMYSPSVNMCSI